MADPQTTVSGGAAPLTESVEQKEELENESSENVAAAVEGGGGEEKAPLLPASFEAANEIIVPGSHRTWTLDEYHFVEHPMPNPFGDCIMKTLRQEDQTPEVFSSGTTHMRFLRELVLAELSRHKNGAALASLVAEEEAAAAGVPAPEAVAGSGSSGSGSGGGKGGKGGGKKGKKGEAAAAAAGGSESQTAANDTVFARVFRLGQRAFPLEIFDHSQTLSQKAENKLKSDLKKFHGIDLSGGGETKLELEKERTLSDVEQLTDFVTLVAKDPQDEDAIMAALENLPVKNDSTFFFLVTSLLLRSKKAKQLAEAAEEEGKAGKQDKKGKDKKKKDKKKKDKKKKEKKEGSWMLKHLANTRLYFEIRITLRSLLSEGLAAVPRAEKRLADAQTALAAAEKARNKAGGKEIYLQAKEAVKQYRAELAAPQSTVVLARALTAAFWGGETEEEEAEATLRVYTKGVFNPVLRAMLQTKREMRMYPEQLHFSKLSGELVENYKNAILTLHGQEQEQRQAALQAQAVAAAKGASEEDQRAAALAAAKVVADAAPPAFPERPVAVVNTNTFGGGKTSVASFATAYQIHEANKALRHTGHRVVGVYILPSLDTILSFASAASQHYVTWLAQRDLFTVFHKWCPWVKTGIKKKPERVYKYVEMTLKKLVEANNWNLVEQATDLRRWHLTNKDIREAKMQFTRHKQFLPPDMIFADSTSALHILELAEEFKSNPNLKWHFMPIIDEFPATADCGIPLEKNEMLRQIFGILRLRTPFSLLMSASPTQRQMTESALFGQYDMHYADVMRATNSFTQLYLHDGTAVHPFSSLDPERVPDAVDTWDETTYRCFPPKVFLALRAVLLQNGLEFPLSIADVRNPTRLIAAIARLCEAIAAAPLPVRQAVCAMRLRDVRQVEVDPRTTLTLLSGDFFGEVLAQLKGKGVTSAVIEAERAAFEKRVKAEIAKLTQDEKSADREGQHMTRDTIKAQIAERESELKHESARQYRFTTPLGSVTIDLWWINEYMYRLPENVLQLVLSGLIMDMRDDDLNAALHAANPQPTVAFAPIACMFGLNDARTDNVCIHDHSMIVGPDTLKQALARAGRSGKKNFVVAGHIDNHLLSCFSGEQATSVEAMDVIYEAAVEEDEQKHGGESGKPAEEQVPAAE
eukprot:INCI19646.1.p1 GENE.INCI19646.1~~INCI19646.1.p1  ORF type:complete len:1178 (+),score=300.97 INCI19646.1:78-3536(+)